jgi:hypothetical protein
VLKSIRCPGGPLDAYRSTFALRENDPFEEADVFRRELRTRLADETAVAMDHAEMARLLEE